VARRKKRTSRSRASAGAAIIWLLHLVNRRTGTVAAWVLGAASIVLGWQYGLPRLRELAALQNRAAAVEVRFMDAPAWLNCDLQFQLELAAQSELSSDPLAQEELTQVRNALLKTGWFDEVHQVRRVRTDLVQVEATFVDPYAVVRDQHGDHLIDSHGTLLPRSYSRATAPQFKVIAGVHFLRPDQAGLPWEGADMTAALRLLRMMERESWFDQVSIIDVTRALEGGSISVITTRGGHIEWGSPPGEERPLERLAEAKVQLLAEQFSRSGLIDGGFDELDLTLQEGSFTR